MAKIDVTQIAGYEAMSTEEKLAALEAFEYNDNAGELERYKNATTKANAEAAEWKRKHNALVSEDELKKQADAEKLTQMEEELKILRREKDISQHKANFIAMGYPEALAQETATALAEGNLNKVFANQQKFMVEHDKAIKAEMLKDVPPPVGGSGKAMSVTDIMKISDPAERQSAIAANIELFERK